jgi:prepilin-type N-terminal cleavage/methylation domain-containing protein
MNQSKEKMKGFTLVELLVVVAIIALLASIILASINTARAKSRDSRRLEDLHTMQIALDLYFNVNGSYPIPFPYCLPDPWNPVMGWASLHTGYTTCWTNLQTSLAPYIKTLPQDPAPQNGDDYFYGAFKNGQGYELLTWLEVSKQKGALCYPDQGDTLGINEGYYCQGENFQ